MSLICLVAINAFLYVGTERLIASLENKSLIQQEEDVRYHNQILRNRILYDGIDTFVMEGPIHDKKKANELQVMASDMDGRIILLGPNFRVIADTYQRNIGQYIITEDTLKAMRGEKRKAKIVGDSYMQVMTGIYNKDTKKGEGVIISLSSLEDSGSLLTFLREQRDAVAGLCFLISVVFSVLLFVFMKRTFRDMRQEMDTYSDGHQEERLSEGGFREFYQMASAFNKITDRYKELENSRQEFVSNVSHELKTPITSMKILADSLLMQDNVPVEIYEEFMEDIVHEIDRENQIITDLLDLVRMDKTSGKLSLEPTNINDLLEELLKRIIPIAQERNITVQLETMRQVVAEVDRGKLSLACTNLIENAVKYNRDEGKVTVYLNADHKFFYIRVKDTGVGIPEDCQERIFERFYRVDKARSRDTGGTGLGLAIARNVVLLHKGSIRVHSIEGQETTFTVRIPLNNV